MTVRFGNNRLGFYGERHTNFNYHLYVQVDLTPSAPLVAAFILSGKVGNSERWKFLSESIIVL